MRGLVLLAMGIALCNFDQGLARDANARTAAKPRSSTVPIPASRPAANNREPAYGGLWASSRKACRDSEGVNHMSIEGGSRFYWYETRCEARDIKAQNGRSWIMRMSCEGEGMKYSASPRLSLATPDRLIVYNGPVGGQSKREVYVRCVGGR